MMNRRHMLAGLGLPMAYAQRSPAPAAASNQYVPLPDGRALQQRASHEGNWDVQNGIVTGFTGARPASRLLLHEREYGNFDLYFDLRVISGSGSVHMRVPGTGLSRVTLQVDTSSAGWFVDGMLFARIFLANRGEWYTYRVICKHSSFDAFQNDVRANMILVAGHLEARGTLALDMPAGVGSEVNFRGIRIRETT